MDPEVNTLMKILGFVNPEMSDLKMKTITSQYRRMSLIKHPDKGGRKEDFQELNRAYEKLGKIINKTPQEDPDDKEETNARDLFKTFNFSKENVESITIFIETNMVKHWETVLTEKFGDPIDRTEEVTGKNNGKQWIDQAFVEGTTCKEASKVYITMWNKKLKGRSTMLIQCEKSKQYLNVCFVNRVIPTIYAEAVEHSKKETTSVKKRVKLQSISLSPKVRRSSRKNIKTFSCKSCDFETANIGTLNTHMKSIHTKETVNKILKPVMSLSKSLSQLLPVLNTEVIPVTIDKSIKCYICGKGFSRVEELTRHVQDEHGDKSTSNDENELIEAEVHSIDKSVKPPVETVMDNPESEKTPIESQEKTDDKDTDDEKTSPEVEEEVTKSPNETVPDMEITIQEDISILQESRLEDFQWDYFCEYESALGFGAKDYNCDKCELTFKEQLSLEEHIYSEHQRNEAAAFPPSTNTSSNVQSATIPSPTVMVPTAKESRSSPSLESPACNKCIGLQILEKEHLELKGQLLNMSSAYQDQFVEREELKHKIIELEIVIRKAEDEKAKLKKEFAKKQKELEAELSDVKTKLKESYEAVKDKVEEITRLSDENKTQAKLMEILVKDVKELSADKEVEAEVIYLKDDEDPYEDRVIESYLQPNRNPDLMKNVVEDDDEIAEVVHPDPGDDIDDDDVIEFYLQQKIERSQRTNPMSEATFSNVNKKQLEENNIKKHKIRCDKCDFTANTKVQLTMHKEALHVNLTLPCQKCDFVSKTQIQHSKHMVVRHGPKQEICWFWQNGHCAKPICQYQHPGSAQRSLVPCHYGNFCCNNFCRFDHSNPFLVGRPRNLLWN